MTLSDYSKIENRSIALHQAIAEKLRANPELLQIAIQNIERWTASEGRSQAYHQEWKEILSKPLQTITELITSPDEKMAALRESTPFAGILSPKERWKIYETF